MRATGSSGARWFGTWCVAGWLMLSPMLLADGRQWSDQHDPLRDEARTLITAARDFLGGDSGLSSLVQLQQFLSADEQDLGKGTTLHILGIKNGGWRRHVAFEEGALQVLTDIVSESGHPEAAAAAARCLAMLAASNNKVREEAATVGTVRLLVKMASISKTKKGL